MNRDIINTFYDIDFDNIIDHPNILIAAHFWEPERYRAACTCYRFMRYIDDLVDNFRSEHAFISADEKTGLETSVNSWINSILASDSNSTVPEELLETVRKFHIPSWPLEAFAKSMIYDIYNDGFPTLKAFLEYASGASVAPAAIFVHLCGLRLENGSYNEPAFDVKQAATPCAIFSYLVHIIRDFVKDHTHNLNYFPDDLMQKYGLNRKSLLEMAHGDELSSGFRGMIGELYLVADEYRLKTLEIKEKIKPLLDTQSRISLDVVYELYLMVFERINVEHGTFTTKELNPTPAEIRKRVWKVLEQYHAFNVETVKT